MIRDYVQKNGKLKKMKIRGKPMKVDFNKINDDLKKDVAKLPVSQQKLYLETRMEVANAFYEFSYDNLAISYESYYHFDTALEEIDCCKELLKNSNLEDGIAVYQKEDLEKQFVNELEDMYSQRYSKKLLKKSGLDRTGVFNGIDETLKDIYCRVDFAEKEEINKELQEECEQYDFNEKVPEQEILENFSSNKNIAKNEPESFLEIIKKMLVKDIAKLPEEQQRTYIETRLSVATAMSKVVNQDLNYIDSIYQDAISDKLYDEKEALNQLIKECSLHSGINEELSKQFTDELETIYSTYLPADVLKSYGWTQDDVRYSITKYMTEATQTSQVNNVFGPSASLQAMREGVSKQGLNKELSQGNNNGFDMG